MNIFYKKLIVSLNKYKKEVVDLKFRDDIDKLHRQIEEIPVSRIIEMRVKIEEIKGQYQFCRCPFHGGNIGSFVITDRMGIFKCFACDASGRGIKFIRLHDNVTYLEAMNRIGLYFGLISQPISNRFKEEKEIYVRSVLKKNDSYIEKRADMKTLDFIFRKLMQYTTLNLEHKNYLLSRGLTNEEIIEDEYFSIPSFREVRDFVSSLKDPDVLNYIPGFFKENGRWKISTRDGIGIPIKNSSNMVSGIQIRITEDGDNSRKIRYFWLSAASKGGVSAGSPVDVIYPNNENKKVSSVCVTEGKFKSRFLSRVGKENNIASISVQGVSSWKNAVSEIGKMDEVNLIKSVSVLFDADMIVKKEVLMQLYKFSSALLEKKKKVFIYLWKEEFGKGIDDIIINGNQKQIKRKEITREELKDFDIFSKAIIESL